MSSRSLLAILPLAVLLPGTLVAQRGDAARDTLRLSVEDAVTRALRAAPEARTAAAQLDVADAQITQARASALPQLTITGNYQQVLENARASIVSQVFGQAFTYSSYARVNQNLFQGGRVVAASRAASSVENSSRLDLQETRALVSVNILRAYLNAQFNAQLVSIQERNYALADERVKQLEQLEKGGRASRFDVLTARVSRSNLEPTVIQARSSAELALLEVKRQLNLPAGQPLVLTSALDATALDPLVQQAVGDSSAVVRPALRSAEFTLEARKQGVRVARADFLPTVSAFFQTGYLALPASNGFPTSLGRTALEFCPSSSTATRPCQNNGWFADRNFGVQISWPLFDGLRTKGNVDLAQAQTQLAQVQLDQVRERVAVEAASARSELERARSALVGRRENVDQADEAYKLAALRFSRGLGTQLEVTDAQLALLTAQTNEARAVYDLYLAVAEAARTRGAAIPLPPTRRAER